MEFGIKKDYQGNHLLNVSAQTRFALSEFLTPFAKDFELTFQFTPQMREVG
jgi:hypothetical protein